MKRTPPSKLAPRRDIRSIAVSVAVHAVLGALVLQVTLGSDRVSRLFRDARVLTLYEGTSEVQRLLIGKHLTGIAAFS